MSSRWSKVALAAIVVTFAVVAVVHAQSGGGVIRACVGADGSLRILSDPTGYSNSNQSCTSANQQHELTWNQQGPAGPTGATGATGAAGASGDGGTGRNFIVYGDSGARKATNHREDFIVAAHCPEGHYATGGGYTGYGTGTLVDPDYILYDGPDYNGHVDGSPAFAKGWTVRVQQSVVGPGTAGLKVFAVCTGDPPPGFNQSPRRPAISGKVHRIPLDPKLKSTRVIRVP
jgi:hypothetical protein